MKGQCMDSGTRAGQELLGIVVHSYYIMDAVDILLASQVVEYLCGGVGHVHASYIGEGCLVNLQGYQNDGSGTGSGRCVGTLQLIVSVVDHHDLNIYGWLRVYQGVLIT